MINFRVQLMFTGRLKVFYEPKRVKIFQLKKEKKNMKRRKEQEVKDKRSNWPLR